MKTKKWQLKLAGYASLSASFLLIGNGASAQVVYVDMDPDTILDLPGEQFTLDIDDNGVNDLTLFNSSFSFFMYTPWWSYWLIQDLIAQVNNEQFSIAGLKDFDFPSYTNYYPYAMNNGDQISDLLAFNNAEYQELAMVVLTSKGENIFDSCLSCYWYGAFVPESIDKYLGFKLQDDLGKNHYGWIRCDVIDTGRTLIIKDYAYELTPDNPILAGDTTHYVSIEQNPIESMPQIYAFGTSIQITGMLTNTTITIFNLSGAKVYETIAASTSISIPMDNFTNGVYLVKLKYEEIDITRKVVLN
jgi:Secretion system C-terminal sorting domain